MVVCEAVDGRNVGDRHEVRLLNMLVCVDLLILDRLVHNAHRLTVAVRHTIVWNGSLRSLGCATRPPARSEGHAGAPAGRDGGWAETAD